MDLETRSIIILGFINKSLIFGILSLFLFSCGGEDDNASNNPDCEFIGKWCTPDPLNSTQCWSLGGITLEFRADGELLQNGTTFFHWKSDDCITIDLHHDINGEKVQEYKVIEVTDTQLTIDIGAVTEFLRDN